MSTNPACSWSATMMYLREVARDVALHLAQRVAAKFLEQRLRQDDRDHRFGDHAHRRYGGHIGALRLRLCRPAGLQVDGLERRHERGNRLHRHAHGDRLPGRHATFGAAGAIRRAREPGQNFVVHFRALAARRFEAQAELDALHGGNRHQRLRQSPVQLGIPRHVRPESHRRAQRDHFDDATQRVAGGLRGVDAADDLLLRLGIQTAYGTLVRAII